MEEKLNHIIYGRNPVNEALRASAIIEKIYFLQGVVDKTARSLRDLAHKQKIPYSFVSRTKLDFLSGGAAHQGVVAKLAMRSYATIEEILNIAAQRKEPHFLLGCFQIQDPHNLGSLIRTGEAVGLHGILIPRKKSVGVTATVSKVASGADSYMPVARVPDMETAVKQLKGRGITIIGAHTAGGQSYMDVRYTMPLVILLGSEGKGLDRRLLDLCDLIVHIPLAGRINSLNVGVAGGILLYEVLRSRQIRMASAPH